MVVVAPAVCQKGAQTDERRPAVSAEALVYGRNAALALATHRPDAIHRVLHDGSCRVEIGPLLKAAAARRKPYREIPAEELEKVAKSTHHEGVVVVADPLPLIELPDLLDQMKRGDVLLALDGVGNPHNLGAILRSAAWFGAAGVIFPREDPRQATLSAAALRVAQGGAEVVPCCGVNDLARALAHLADQGITLAGADQRADRGLFDGPLPRPLCLVMGNESTGLSPAVARTCHGFVRIPGTGQVESLNVAVSAGILLAATLASWGR
jgi:TrmH RNA methyltransferase